MMEVTQMKETRKLWLVLVLCILLAACGGQEGVKDECIGTFEEFAYDVLYYDEDEYTSPGKILPKAPWTLEYELPEGEYFYRFLGVREKKGDIEIWINRIHLEDLSKANEKNEIIIFKPASKELTILSATVDIEGVHIWVDRLFFSKDGSIWGRNDWSRYLDYSKGTLPILSKFNEETQRFELVENSFRIPVFLDAHGLRDWKQIFLDDGQGVFWFFEPYDGLYSYRIKTGEITKHADIPEYPVSDPNLAPDGNFYFRFYIEPEMGPDGIYYWDEVGIRVIYKYSSGTGELSIYDTIPESWPKTDRILVDSSGRIWVGTFGWLDTDGTWHLMHPDIDLYYERVVGMRGFMYVTPIVSMESSNGYIWFISYREIDYGWAWYDPQTGESCWFINTIAGILEDPDQIMWLIMENQLYTYVLGE